MDSLDTLEHAAVAGHNNPPSAIETARDAYKALSDFLAETPVIQDQETAKAAKLQLDRIKATAGDLEAAKTAETAPHYAAWQTALAKYKPAADSLAALTTELAKRIRVFLDAEEDRRRKEADRIRREAEEAALKAAEAARAEAEARENAAVGEIGVDIGQAVDTLAYAAIDAAKLERQATVAERDADNVRLGGGFGRSISVRVTMKPVIEDWKVAIKAIGLTDDISAAILKGARAFKKLKGAWPKGIGEVEERSL